MRIGIRTMLWVCFVELLGLAVTRACCVPPPPRCPPRSSRPARPNPQSWPTPSCPAAPRLEKRRHFYSHPLAQVRITGELVFLNVYGGQESIPRNEFRQPI
jgi:hypothetical protein